MGVVDLREKHLTFAFDVAGQSCVNDGVVAVSDVELRLTLYMAA